MESNLVRLGIPSIAVGMAIMVGSALLGHVLLARRLLAESASSPGDPASVPT